MRYDEENQAVDVLGKLTEAMTDGIVLNGSKLECRVLEGKVNYRISSVIKWSFFPFKTIPKI